MRGLWWVIFGLACGCAETPLEMAVAEPLREEAPPIQQSPELAPPGDSFWMAEAISEARKPPPLRPRSVSLGYVGDSPLTGGVMRDTPLAAPAAAFSGAPSQPNCSCALSPSGYLAEGYPSQ